MTEEDNEDFKNYTNSWICDNDYINKSYNKLQNSCRCFQPKELWFPSYYAISRQVRF